MESHRGIKDAWKPFVPEPLASGFVDVDVVIVVEELEVVVAGVVVVLCPSST